MPNIGMGELVVVLLIVLLVFGASRLPQIGEGVGKAIKNFKRGLNTDDDIDVSPKEKKLSARSTAEKLPTEATEEAEVVERKS